MNEDFITFKEYVDDDSIKLIARLLGLKIRPIANDLFREPGDDPHDALARFFTEVCRVTEEEAKQTTPSYFTSLVDNWRGSKSTPLALATYYYLHTIRTGRVLSAEIDRAIFKGQTFAEAHGHTVPGGYEPPAVERPNQIIAMVAVPQPRLCPPPKSARDTHYSNRVVDLLGRNEEMEALRRFVNAGPGFRWFQIAGAAGQGKSRLAHELVLELEDSWAKGILRKADLEDFQTNWASWNPTRPHLLVIDYVVGSEPQIGRAMGILASRSAVLPVAVRVLLLERQRWDQGGFQLAIADHTSAQHPSLTVTEGRADWFGVLNQAAGESDLAADEFRHEAGVVELSHLGSDALLGLVRSLIPADDNVGPPDDGFIKSALDSIDRSGRPLYAYFLAQSLSDRSFRLGWSKGNLLHHVLTRNQERRWSAEWPTHSTRVSYDHPAARLAVLATMVGQVDCRRLGSTARELLSSNVDADTIRKARVIADNPLEHGALGQIPVVRGLEPGILGEYFVIQFLERDSAASSLAQAAWHIAPKEMAAFLVRLTQDFPDSAIVADLLELELPTDDSQSEAASVAATIVSNLAKHWHPVPAKVIHHLSVAAESDDQSAMACLGTCYFQGTGVARNIDKALHWYNKAANAGSARGLYCLGLCYLQGYGVPANQKAAFELFSKAAEKGEPLGAIALGNCYQMGWGTDHDPDRAFSLYHEAMMAKAPGALSSIGSCFLNGIGTQQNTDEALKWFHRGAAAGCGDSMNHIGKCHQDGVGGEVDLKAAADYYERGAMARNQFAMFNFGQLLMTGSGIEKDVPKAIQWFERSARAGLGKAATVLAALFQSGELFPVDIQKNLQWLRVGTELNDPLAMNDLAAAYELGTSVGRDIEIACGLYQTSADMGNPFGAFNLARMYNSGQCVPQDISKAVELYRSAADGGISVAALNLGLIYRAHPEAVQKDEHAAFWFLRALNDGVIEAHAPLADCYQNGVGVEKNPLRALELIRTGADAGDAVAMNYLGFCYLTGFNLSVNKTEAIRWFLASAEAGDTTAMFNLVRCYYRGDGVRWSPLKGYHWFRRLQQAQMSATKLGSPVSRQLAFAPEAGLFSRWVTSSILETFPKLIHSVWRMVRTTIKSR